MLVGKGFFTLFAFGNNYFLLVQLIVRLNVAFLVQQNEKNHTVMGEFF